MAALIAVVQAARRVELRRVAMHPSAQLTADLQRKARAILDPLIPDGSDVVLLDYPNYKNVGDSLIWLGELEYLRSRGISPRYVCDVDNYRAAAMRRCLRQDTVILLSGGGNFGTLYPRIQKLREAVMADFPGQRIVQLSQSVCFENERDLERSRALIVRHGNFVLLARDEATHALATQHFDCEIFLCPDMAFFLGPLSGLPPRIDVLALSRSDAEKNAMALQALQALARFNSVETCDWLTASQAEERWKKLLRKTRTIQQRWDRHNRWLGRGWAALARARMARGCEMLSRGKIIVTDRLHGHILALLLGRPHIILDNQNGKVKSFYRTWTNASTLTHLCESPEDVLPLVEALLRAQKDIESKDPQD